LWRKGIKKKKKKKKKEKGGRKEKGLITRSRRPSPTRHDVIKLFLHISKEDNAALRLAACTAEDRWKFQPADLAERESRDDSPGA